MKLLKLLIVLFAIITLSANAQLQITAPTAGTELRVGRTVTIKWTTDLTFEKTFQFYASTEGPNGPWEILKLSKNATEFKDVNSKDKTKPAGSTITVLPRKATTNLYIKMEEKGNPSLSAMVGPLTIKVPQAAVVDSTLTGDITSTVTLSANKIYGLKGIVFVQEGATLRIDPGTVILGEVGNTSAICVNRGGKIYANGTADKPIVMTSGAQPGERDRGDWGGLLIMGKAQTNVGEAPIEGGIADGVDVKKNAWYGGNDDADSSGVLRYVRIEFAGIAESPDNELNSLTMGAVGSRTVIDYVQCSYNGDDAYEWFGGTVNMKHLIAYNTIDDDIDTDNGYRGKVQFVLVKRFSDIADQSNSEAFESDNDSKSTEKTPFTSAVVSNVTAIGPFAKMSWELGKEVNPKFLAGAQIRRNSRLSIYNSLFTGWPRGVEMTNQNTVRGAAHDSSHVSTTSFYGIKDETKKFYFGSGTVAEGKVTADWLTTVETGNVFSNGTSDDVNTIAQLTNAYPNELALLDPSPVNNAEYLTTASFPADPIVPIGDDFFTKVTYRGAFAAGERWDDQWAEYDPVNAEYVAKDLQITAPTAGTELRVGRTVTIKWTTDLTFEKTFQFYASTEGPNGPWEILKLSKNATEFKDVNSKDKTKPAGSTITVLPRKATTNLYIKMEEKGNPSLSAMVGPLTIKVPQAAVVDSTLTGDITSTVTLSANKIYGLKGIVFVQEGATLRIDPGTVILGEVGNTSAICVNRGGKIYANGTADKPIVMTSGAQPGERDRGDWGGLLIMGKAQTNVGEAPIEGGIADGVDVKKNAWYGGNDDADSSGVLRYVRIEFAGIAESPDNELNSLTMGAVGSRTVIDYVQCSYNGDDAYEWFGGTVNMKHLIAYNTIDDDIDTDNGYRGKVQFVLVKRFSDIADQSNSEAFESDNDSKSTEKTPFTSAVVSNVTAIGPFAKMSWELGKEVNPKFLAGAQIRRNSRLSIYNSLFTGWPRGVEMTNQNTVRGAAHDSSHVSTTSFYGIKDETKKFYFGSGTVAEGKVTADWLTTVETGNVFSNGTSDDVNTIAQLTNAYPNELALLDPSPVNNAEYLTTASFPADPIVPIGDDFFTKVTYRGAFAAGERWDDQWAEYDPVNAEYVASVNDNYNENILSSSIYPQPASNYATLNFHLINPESVTLRLIDAYGNELSKVELGLLNTGFQTQLVDLNRLSNGVYFVQILTNSGYTTQKIVVVK